EWEDVKSEVEELSRLYWLTFDSPASFIQTITEDEFHKLVNELYQEQRGWNPPYAPEIKIPKSIETFCMLNTPLNVIKEFNLPGRVHRTEAKEEGEVPGTPGEGYVLFPFDGWTLAHCLKLSYENANHSRE
ncbi:hypothetical protein KY339_04060, partial [Candidatus Woesearchaeota archaeon]|nr:hypothetical protein [Candidatus Woesearchaeota archaeon]